VNGPRYIEDDEEPCPYCPKRGRCRCAEYDDGERRYDESQE
jgi:hypothetical protein